MTAQAAVPTSTHLVLLVNGLFSTPRHWARLTDALRRADAGGHLLYIYPSRANTYFQTYAGIDTCGQVREESLCALCVREACVLCVGELMWGSASHYTA